nr:hypothetical protein [Streptococcus minor]
MGLQEYLYSHLPFLGDENFKHLVLMNMCQFLIPNIVILFHHFSHDFQLKLCAIIPGFELALPTGVALLNVELPETAIKAKLPKQFSSSFSKESNSVGFCG